MNRQLIEAFQSEIESALDAENYELVQALRRIRDRAREDEQDPPSLFTVFSNGYPSHYTTVNQ